MLENKIGVNFQKPPLSRGFQYRFIDSKLNPKPDNVCILHGTKYSMSLELTEKN